MKYYSEKTNKIYDSAEDLEKAEKDLADKLAEKQKFENQRKLDFQKVKDAYALADAQKKAADEMFAEFCKKYDGKIHGTITLKDKSEVEKEAREVANLINSIIVGFPFLF